MSASPSADSRRSASLDLDIDDRDIESISTTPLSGSGSGLSSLSGASGSGSQSTKDRRRERNRLAAQKHRLRRNERMAQLEAQVLALQQDKAMLVARLDAKGDQPSALPAPSPPPAAPAASAPPAQITSALDSVEPELRERERKRPRTADPEPPSPIEHAYRRSLSPPSPRLPRLASPSMSVSGQGQDSPSTVRQLEARIRELECYTASLASELSTHLSSTSGTLDRLHHLTAERAQTLSELGSAHAAVSRLRGRNEELAAQNVSLREELEGAEVALELQRVENERLRERVGKEERDGREEREECRRLRRALRVVEDEAAQAAAAAAQAQAQVHAQVQAEAEAVAQAARMSFKREEAYQRQWDAIQHHNETHATPRGSGRVRVQQLESAERDRRLVSVR